MESLVAKLAPVLVAGASLALATPASALQLVSATGVFQNPGGPGALLPGNVVFEPPYLNPQPAATTPTQIAPTGIRWGDPAPDPGDPALKNGLRFIGFAPATGVSIPTDGSEATIEDIFEIDYINFPTLAGSELTSLDLVITYNFDTLSPVIQTIPITILETTNSGTCDPPSGLTPPVPCPDVVTLTEPSVGIIPINGGPEFLELTLSFPTTGTNQIIVEEGQQNPFFIDAGFRRAPAPIPFGAVGALSLFAGGFRRLRKRYASIMEDPA